MIISKKAYLLYATHFAITDQNDEIWKTDGWHAGTSLSYIRGVVPQMMRPATTCQMTQTDAATIAAVAACTASPYTYPWSFKTQIGNDDWSIITP